jgi:hypothetical protein
MRFVGMPYLTCIYLPFLNAALNDVIMNEEKQKPYNEFVGRA